MADFLRRVAEVNANPDLISRVAEVNDPPNVQVLPSQSARAKLVFSGRRR